MAQEDDHLLRLTAARRPQPRLPNERRDMGRRSVAGRQLDRRCAPVAGIRSRPRARRRPRRSPPLAHGHRPQLDGAPRPDARRRLGPRRRPAHQHPRHERRPGGGHRLRPRLRPRRRPPRSVPGSPHPHHRPRDRHRDPLHPADTHIQAQPAADIWSLGASLFWCWTGQRPVAYDDDLDRLEKLAAIARGTTTALRDVRPWPFPEFEDAITACLAPDPAARPTAKELTAAW